MELKDKLERDFKEALKTRDEILISTLRLLRAALLNKEKEKRSLLAKKEEGLSEKELLEKSQLSEEEILGVLSSEVKKRRESISQFEKGGRFDLVEKEKKELEILSKYLPKQLTKEEIEKIVKDTIEELGARDIKDMGKVMQVLVKKIKSRAEGKQISEIVKNILSK